jgi:hypothetical protein
MKKALDSGDLEKRFTEHDIRAKTGMDTDERGVRCVNDIGAPRCKHDQGLSEKLEADQGDPVEGEEMIASISIILGIPKNIMA